MSEEEIYISDINNGNEVKRWSKLVIEFFKSNRDWQKEFTAQYNKDKDDINCRLTKIEKDLILIKKHPDLCPYRDNINEIPGLKSKVNIVYKEYTGKEYSRKKMIVYAGLLATALTIFGMVAQYLAVVRPMLEKIAAL